MLMRWQIVLGLVLIMVGLMVRNAWAQGAPEPAAEAAVEAAEAPEPVTDNPQPDADLEDGDDPEVAADGEGDVEDGEDVEVAEEEAAPTDEEPGVAEEPDAEAKEAPEATAGEEPKKGVVVLKRSSRPARKRGPFTVLGAAALDREDTALRIAIGYPEVHAVYHMPWDTDIEFGMGGGFFYAFNANSTAEIYGGKLIGEGRWRFFKDGQHSVALVANPALELGSGHTDFVAGLTVGFPGVVYDYAIKNENHAILGFSVPFGFYGSDEGFAARIPLVLKAGMEFELTDLVHLFISFEMGADIWTGDAPLPDGEGVYLFTRGLTGAGVIL
jgi:hypothetical protein